MVDFKSSRSENAAAHNPFCHGFKHRPCGLPQEIFIARGPLIFPEAQGHVGRGVLLFPARGGESRRSFKAPHWRGLPWELRATVAVESRKLPGMAKTAPPEFEQRFRCFRGGQHHRHKRPAFRIPETVAVISAGLRETEWGHAGH